MRQKIIGGWLGGIHRHFCRLEANFSFRYIWKPIILGLPPLVITGFYTDKTWAPLVLSVAPGFADLLTTHSNWAVIFAAGYPGTMVAITQYAAKKVQPKTPNVDRLLALLSTIDGVVGAKLNRFSEFLLRSSSMTKETAFCAITEPEKQIEELVRGVCEFFNAGRPSSQKGLIRVVLAVMDDGNVSALPIFFPRDEPVRATVEELNDPRSAIRLAANSKKILVIEDIAKEIKKPVGKRRYVEVDSEDDQSGSLICYPVYYNRTREVPFVISIHCEEEGFFKSEQADMYALYLQRFAIRLCLEYSLQKLKGELSE